ncbi:hypothetical protein Patl1_11740 [Pistacia atlantica]|uniref:Uncharacterized protein n=1 Tax=Pistacia atlantica TaxID=434234 RepID=A0ACC1A125_9ROSI|nr:hypothetical protein Patl1_11740 [Pistacia atlantica]
MACTVGQVIRCKGCCGVGSWEAISD